VGGGLEGSKQTKNKKGCSVMIGMKEFKNTIKGHEIEASSLRYYYFVL